MTRVFTYPGVGMCAGVKRTVKRALEAAREAEDGSIFALGELVHNRAIVDDLARAGIETVTDLARPRRGDTVIIRAHGVPPEDIRALDSGGVRVLDLTCPRVSAIHRAIEERARRGVSVFVVGYPDHPETRGHLGYAGASGRCLESCEAAAQIDLCGPAAVVAQTTVDGELFDRIVSTLQARDPGIEVLRTLCASLTERQGWIRKISTQVDACIIVGGRNSSNTLRLFEIAQALIPTFMVESARELDVPALARYETLALTSGASTPIESVRDLERALGRAGMVIEGA